MYCMTSLTCAQRKRPCKNSRPIATCSAVESFTWPTFRTSLSVGVFYFIQNDCIRCCRNKQRKVSTHSDVDVRKVGRLDSSAAN